MERTASYILQTSSFVYQDYRLSISQSGYLAGSMPITSILINCL